MFVAVNALEGKLGKDLTLEDIGARVAEAYPGRDEDFSPSVVRRWLKGLNPPRTRTGWIALAKALDVDPGWLTYGTGSMARVEATPYHGDPVPPKKKR